MAKLAIYLCFLLNVYMVFTQKCAHFPKLLCCNSMSKACSNSNVCNSVRCPSRSEIVKTLKQQRRRLGLLDKREEVLPNANHNTRMMTNSRSSGSLNQLNSRRSSFGNSRSAWLLPSQTVRSSPQSVLLRSAGSLSSNRWYDRSFPSNSGPVRSTAVDSKTGRRLFSANSGTSKTFPSNPESIRSRSSNSWSARSLSSNPGFSKLHLSNSDPNMRRTNSVPFRKVLAMRYEIGENKSQSIEPDETINNSDLQKTDHPSDESDDVSVCGIAPDYNPCVSDDEANARFLRCCAKQDVGECAKLCSYAVTAKEARAAIVSQKCSTSGLGSYFECSSDGKNNQDCCKSRGVDPRCLMFCDGTTSPTAVGIQHLVCLNSLSDIMMCHYAGLT